MRIQTRTAAGTGVEGERICPAEQLETSDFVWFSHAEPDGQALRENAPILPPIAIPLPVELPVEFRLPYSTGKAGRDGRVERGNDRAS